MTKIVRTLLGTGALCFAAFQLSAQQLTEPPKLLRIFREDVKEGRGALHEKTETRYAQALARLKYPATSIGLVSMTGTPQAWFLEAEDSFAAIADTEAFLGKTAVKTEMDALDAQDAEARSGSRAWIAAYRPDMSYHAKELVERLPKSHFYTVIIFRVRQDRDQEFAEVARTAIAAAEKSNDDQPLVTYQVVSGANSGTYLLFEPIAGLKSLDEMPARSRAMYQAMGESGMKRFLKTASEVIVSSESLLFSVNPKMSYVSKEFAAVDPEFWAPKATATAKPPAKAPEKSTASK